MPFSGRSAHHHHQLRAFSAGALKFCRCASQASWSLVPGRPLGLAGLLSGGLYVLWPARVRVCVSVCASILCLAPLWSALTYTHTQGWGERTAGSVWFRIKTPRTTNHSRPTSPVLSGSRQHLWTVATSVTLTVSVGFFVVGFYVLPSRCLKQCGPSEWVDYNSPNCVVTFVNYFFCGKVRAGSVKPKLNGK